MDFKEELQKTTTGDVIHAVMKGTVSSIPLLGNILSEAFTLAITQPAEIRKENMLILLDERLMELERNSISIKSLAENELFLSCTLQATQIAMRTHQKEKIMALINAISNTASISSIDDNIALMYLSYIDLFNEWHLRVLLFFNNPKECYKVRDLSYNDLFGQGPGEFFYRFYPELRIKEGFTKQIINDLYQKGLIDYDSSIFYAKISINEQLSSRTTDTGKEFLRFISTPDFII